MKFKVKCYFCDKIIYKFKCRLKNNNYHFCNKKCLEKYFNSCYKKLKCNYCKKVFFVYNSYSNGKFHFCSKKCQKKFNGSGHWNYVDGSCGLYPLEFNNKLKEFIRKRDSYKCMNCGIPQKECFKNLDIHHIDYNKKNNDGINLISLCQKCHSSTNGKRKYWKNYYEQIQIDRKVHLLDMKLEMEERFE